MKLVAKALVVLVLAAVCCAQTGEWQRYTNEAGNFSVLMPQTPQEIGNTDTEQETARTVQAMAAGAAYGVIYDRAKKDDRVVDQHNFDLFQKGFIDSVGTCKVVDEAAPTRVLTNYIGKWYQLACEVDGTSLKIQLNMYWGRRYAYVVMVAYPGQAPDVNKFLDSFRLLDNSR